MKRKIINDKTFKTFVELCWDCTEQEFLNYANKKNKTNHKITDAFGKTIVGEEANCCIWINKKDNQETLAHEILHLIRFWLQDFYGINLNQETEEIYTMLHSFYFRECLKILK